MSTSTSPASASASAKITSNARNSSSSAKDPSSPFLFAFGTICHVVLACFAIYLIPLGKFIRGERFNITALYDILFTDKLGEYAHLREESLAEGAASFVGPALLASFTRFVNLVFDDRIRGLAFVHLKKFLPEPTFSTIKLYLHDTRMLPLLAARLLMAAFFIGALAQLRSALSGRYRSGSAGRVLSFLMASSVLPFLHATRLTNSTFSASILLLALAYAAQNHFSRAVSLLTLNALIFDIRGGSILLGAFTAAFLATGFGKRTSAAGSGSGSAASSFAWVTALAVTVPLAIAVSMCLDSLLYNRFVWPQGEVLLQSFAVIKGLINHPSAISNLIQTSVAAASSKDCWIGLLASLAPAIVAFPLTAGDAFTRASLLCYLFSTPLLFNGNYDLIISLVLALTALSGVITRGLIGGSPAARKAQSLGTGIFFYAILCPALVFFVARPHVEISQAMQFGGEAVMALNRRLVATAADGSVTRVLLAQEAWTHGVSPFTYLTSRDARTFSYSTVGISNSGIPASFRPDYVIRAPAECPNEAKSMKTFSGFKKLHLSLPPQIQIELIPRVGVYRAAQCPASDEDYAAARKEDVLTETGKLLAKYIIPQASGSVVDQRAFIAKHLGSINHKKFINMIGIVIYIYSTLLEQL